MNTNELNTLVRVMDRVNSLGANTPEHIVSECNKIISEEVGFRQTSLIFPNTSVCKYAELVEGYASNELLVFTNFGIVKVYTDTFKEWLENCEVQAGEDMREFTIYMVVCAGGGVFDYQNALLMFGGN